MRGTRFFSMVLAVVFCVLAGIGCGPSTVEECLDRAALSASAGKWKQAFKLASRAEDIAPGNIEALLLKAVAADNCGEKEEAFKAASRAVELDKNNFSVQYTLGRICMNDPVRYEEAENALKKALQLRPRDRDTLVLLCNLCSSRGSSKTISFLLMLKNDPEFARDPAVFNQLGIAYLRSKQLAKAQQAFTNAWNFGRNDPEVTYNTACFFDRYTKAAPTARALYQRYLQLSAGDAEAKPFRQVATERIKVLGRR